MQQHDAYQAAFGHLLRDLKVDDYMPSGLTVPMVALFFNVWPNYLYLFRTFQGQLTSQVFNKKKNTLSNMSTISIADILELPVQERIRLVELIWDSIAALPEAVEISPALKAELETRLAEFEANPEAGYSWDQVKSHLNDGSWRTV